jgi:hypothetical protein
MTLAIGIWQLLIIVILVLFMLGPVLYLIIKGKNAKNK